MYGVSFAYKYFAINKYIPIQNNALK